MASLPITLAHPRTIRKGPLAGATFTTERGYRQALAAIRGETYAPPKRQPGEPLAGGHGRAVAAYQRQKRDEGVQLSRKEIRESVGFKELWSILKPYSDKERAKLSKEDLKQRAEDRNAIIAKHFKDAKAFWVLYHQLKQGS